MKTPALASGIAALIVGMGSFAVQGANRADVHMAVYSSGFLLDTQRQVTLDDNKRHVQIKTQAKGTAQGETPESGIDIDRLDLGLQWNLDPRAKTFTEQRYQASFSDTGRPESAAAPGQPVTLKLTRIDPKVSGPSGTATINGVACQAYTIRLVADFTDTTTGKVVATETLLEKLWVTEKAPGIQGFRKAETNFQDALSAVHGTETADFRWMLREFNRHILELNGNPEDFKRLQAAYQGARADISGVTVRQLAGWNWRPLDETAPGSMSADEMTTFIASIVGGLGAPPDLAGKTALSDADKPRWVVDLEKDLGRGGPTAMFLQEVLRVSTVKASPDLFEIPSEYKRL